MTEPGSVPVERDLIDARRVVLVLVASLLVAAAAIVGSRLLHRTAGAPPPYAAAGPAFAARAPDHHPLDGHERGVTLRAAQTERLNHYSRVDGRPDTVCIPIARAIELELGARP